MGRLWASSSGFISPNEANLPKRVITVCVRTKLVAIALLVVLLIPWAGLSPSRAQNPGQKTTVIIDILGTPGKKINIAVPEFTVVSGTESTGAAKLLASVTGSDLTFSGLFSVVAGTGAIPANNPAALAQSWQEFAAAGAHAGLHGLLTVRPDRLDGEMRLYDLTTPEQRLIATKKFDTPIAQPRRLAHKIADEVVLQFTGEPGIADTKLAYVAGPRGAKEIVMADYDGTAPAPVTRNGSINLTPVWSPDARSLAYTSYKQGYPDCIARFRSSAGRSRRWPPSSASTRHPRSALTARASRSHCPRTATPRSTSSRSPRARCADLRATPASTRSRRGRRTAASSRSSPTATARRTST